MDFISRAGAAHRTAALHFPLVVAVAIWSTPALALDQRNIMAVGVCDPGASMDYRLSPERRDHKSSRELACNDLLSAGGMIDVEPNQGDPIGIATQVQYWSVAGGSSLTLDGSRHQPGRAGSGSGDARQDGKLSPLRSIPVFFSGTAQSGNDRHEEPPVRASANPVAQPGTWVVLIAGFLGMCAVARRRIFPS